MKYFKKIFLLVILMVAIKPLLYATTFTFLGTVDSNYTTSGNWEGGSYPGLLIEENDTVLIRNACLIEHGVIVTVEGLFQNAFDAPEGNTFVRGELRIGALGQLLWGFGIIVGEMGIIHNDGKAIGFPMMNVFGKLSGRGYYDRVSCQDCTIYPGEKGEVGSVEFFQLNLSEESKIVFDILSDNSDGTSLIDTLKGGNLFLRGELVVNYVSSISPPKNCTFYNPFEYSGFLFDFSKVSVVPFEDYAAAVTNDGFIILYESPTVDGALDFGRYGPLEEGLYGSVNKRLDTIRTIEFRLYPESMTIPESRGMVMGFNGSIDQYVFFGENNTNLDRGQEILAVVNGGRMYVQNDTASGKVLSHDWHHYAITDEDNDGKYDQMYIDNSAYEIKGTLADVFVVEELLLGRRNSGSSPLNFNGRIDEVRLWNVTRSFTDIFENNNCSLEPSDTVGLVAYYKMDQGIGQGDNCDKRLYDSSGKNHHGSIESNFDLFGPIANWVDLTHCPDYGSQIQNEDSGGYEGAALFWNNNSEWRQGIPEACHDVNITHNTHIDVMDKNARCLYLQVDSSSIFSVKEGIELNVFGPRY